MKVHIIQHVSFESPGLIADWAIENDAQITFTRVFAGDEFPEQPDCDVLVIMGGPMGANDDDVLPWMTSEKRMIRQTIDQGIKIVGICLGAQLIASVLGARVYPNCGKEIGWWPVNTSSSAIDFLPAEWPETWTSFHWHGDTFDLPAGAERLFSTAICPNQGFNYRGQILALQFHMEATPNLVASMTTHCGDELSDGTYIQTADIIKSSNEFFDINRRLFFSLLDQFINRKIL